MKKHWWLIRLKNLTDNTTLAEHLSKTNFYLDKNLSLGG